MFDGQKGVEIMGYGNSLDFLEAADILESCELIQKVENSIFEKPSSRIKFLFVKDNIILTSLKLRIRHLILRTAW